MVKFVEKRNNVVLGAAGPEEKGQLKLTLFLMPRCAQTGSK